MANTALVETLGMVDTHTPEILAGVTERLSGAAAPPPVASGHDAAVAVVDLVQRTFDAIQPKAIVEAFLGVKDRKPKEIAEGLWQQFGDATIGVMTGGSRCLAHLWDAARKAGGGGRTIGRGKPIDQQTLLALYSDRRFLPSKTLDEIRPLLRPAGAKGDVASAAEGNGRAPAPPHRRAAPKRAPRTSRRGSAKGLAGPALQDSGRASRHRP